MSNVNLSEQTFDVNLCLARKNQNEHYHLQCPFNKKNGDFCGKHKTYLTKKLIPINELSEKTTRINVSDKSITDNNNEDANKIPVDDGEDKKIVKEKSPKMTKKKLMYVIKPYEYHKISKTTLTLIDYLYDKELKYTDSYIKKSYKYYKLDYYLPKKKKLRLINKDQKDLHIKQIKSTLQEFFETLLISYINIDKIVFLQSKVKKYIENKSLRIHGPAYNNRTICNNPTDFYSFDPIVEIEDKYFFSYRDADDFVYGFHIESFINLISNDTEPSNPYNRVIISKEIKDIAIQMWQDLNKNKEVSNYTNNNSVKDLKHLVRNKCLMVLQKMDIFGYQTKMDWILDLPISRTRQLFRSIKNNWNYKAGLSTEVKERIFPDGNPFLSINLRKLDHINRYVVLDTVLEIMDLLVSNGVTNDDKNQGCILVLFAINDVNRECGRCNPWLI
jgi:hypothetical protein